MTEKEKEPEHPDLRELDALISEKLGLLMDHNHDLVKISRRFARDMQQIAEIYSKLEDLALEISELGAKMAFATAGITFDLVKAEWQFQEDDDGDEDEGSDDCG